MVNDPWARKDDIVQASHTRPDGQAIPGPELESFDCFRRQLLTMGALQFSA
jgi:hypothetical protein